MSKRASGANAKRSAVRARVEHVFAHQKDQKGLFIRTIGIARAEAKITLANLVYNIDRPDLPRTAGHHGIAASGEGGFRLGQPKSHLRASTTEREAVFVPQSAPHGHVDVGAQLYYQWDSFRGTGQA